jgi:hypothetical protein
MRCANSTLFPCLLSGTNHPRRQRAKSSSSELFDLKSDYFCGVHLLVKELNYAFEFRGNDIRDEHQPDAAGFEIGCNGRPELNDVGVFAIK